MHDTSMSIQCYKTRFLKMNAILITFSEAKLNWEKVNDIDD